MAVAKGNKQCTAIVSYRVKHEDVDTFLEAWQMANDFLKKQPGHVTSTLHRAISANPAFRFVNVAQWKTVDNFRDATQAVGYQEAAGRLTAYPVYAAAYEAVPS